MLGGYWIGCVLLKRLYVHKMSRVIRAMMHTMFYDSRCLNATYQWLKKERVSDQVWQFSDMKQFVCHQVAFMEKFCGRIGQVIVIYHPILYFYSPTLQPHQLASKMGGATDSQNK